MNQYAEPPREFTSVPLDDLYPLGRTAEDPQLVVYANDRGYVEVILPETGGMDLVGAVAVFLIVIWWLLIWISEKEDD